MPLARSAAPTPSSASMRVGRGRSCRPRSSAWPDRSTNGVAHVARLGPPVEVVGRRLASAWRTQSRPPCASIHCELGGEQHQRGDAPACCRSGRAGCCQGDRRGRARPAASGRTRRCARCARPRPASTRRATARRRRRSTSAERSSRRRRRPGPTAARRRRRWRRRRRAGRRRHRPGGASSIATPVEVSLWVRAYTSTSSSATAPGWCPAAAATTTGRPRCGAAAQASANFDENSPNTRCWLRRSTRPNVATSQNTVVPPLPRTISQPSGSPNSSVSPRAHRADELLAPAPGGATCRARVIAASGIELLAADLGRSAAEPAVGRQQVGGDGELDRGSARSL